MDFIHSNVMVVEDHDQQGVVIGTMKHNGVTWPEQQSKWPVFVDVARSVDLASRPASLSARLKASGLTALGVVVDADDNFVSKWSSIRNFCISQNFKGVPVECPRDGFIIGCAGKKFGAWIMPNCMSVGRVESFCESLVPDRTHRLWEYAETACFEAESRGAEYKKCHREKALIHTWLAWQDPPGLRMGMAITKKILDPNCASSQNFVSWFKKLYNL